jgi:hypothetical protein
MTNSQLLQKINDYLKEQSKPKYRFYETRFDCNYIKRSSKRFSSNKTANSAEILLDDANGNGNGNGNGARATVENRTKLDAQSSDVKSDMNNNEVTDSDEAKVQAKQQNGSANRLTNCTNTNSYSNSLRASKSYSFDTIDQLLAMSK